ncbi:MAG: response regulator [Prochloraceae cyanobacterium]
MNFSEKKILLVDDESAIHAIVELSLQMQAGWQTISAAKGVEGLKLARSQRPDAILLDLMMPEVSGVTILKQLKADPITKSIPVILLSAKKVETSTEDFLRDLAVAGAIAKPFNPLTLSSKISAFLGW